MSVPYGIGDQIIADAAICLRATETSRETDYLNDLGAKIRGANGATRWAFSQVIVAAVVIAVFIAFRKAEILPDTWSPFSPLEEMVVGVGVLVASLAWAGIQANRAAEAQFYYLTKCLDRRMVGSFKPSNEG